MPSSIPATAVSENLQKHVDPKAPAPLRIMAAKGMVPMGPRDLVTVLAILGADDDEKVSSSAQKSLRELPEKIVRGALNEALHPLVFDSLARAFPDRNDYLEPILLNKETPDETFAFLASRVGEKMLAIIVENQVRQLRHREIVLGILENKAARKSDIDRVMDFAVRVGMELHGVAQFEEARARLSGAPRDLEAEKTAAEAVIESLPEDMLKEETEEAAAPNPEAAEEKKLTLLQRLAKMTTAQKVALAQKGNKSVRMQLVKESNRVVATAAIRNPGVNEAEVATIASNRAISDDVIRIIAQNREWTRNYPVKLALMNNPKTPLTVSMRFLTQLRVNDLKTLSTNKNVPSALAQAAKKLLQTRMS